MTRKKVVICLLLLLACASIRSSNSLCLRSTFLDVTFLIDETVSKDHFEQFKYFIKSIVDELQIGIDKNRIGIYT